MRQGRLSMPAPSMTSWRGSWPLQGTEIIDNRAASKAMWSKGDADTSPIPVMSRSCYQNPRQQGGIAAAGRAVPVQNSQQSHLGCSHTYAGRSIAAAALGARNAAGTLAAGRQGAEPCMIRAGEELRRLCCGMNRLLHCSATPATAPLPGTLKNFSTPAHQPPACPAPPQFGRQTSGCGWPSCPA